MYKSLILGFSDFFDVRFSVGELIDGRYRLLKWLGTGGYGRSFLVEDVENNQKVVLKALRLHKRMSRYGRKGFMAESEMLKSLKHSSFPEVYATGEVKGVPYFTMDFIEGKTFEQLIFDEGKTFDERETFIIGLELIQIIGYIHNKGVVHRDIRIPNVMVQENQALKLIDFGLARNVDFKVKNPIRNKQNRMKDISFQSDFYALGHFLLFLLYSGYQNDEGAKERSWEVELALPLFNRSVLRKLLQLDEPYEKWQHINEDFLKIINR